MHFDPEESVVSGGVACAWRSAMDAGTPPDDVGDAPNGGGGAPNGAQGTPNVEQTEPEPEPEPHEDHMDEPAEVMEAEFRLFFLFLSY